MIEFDNEPGQAPLFEAEPAHRLGQRNLSSLRPITLVVGDHRDLSCLGPQLFAVDLELPNHIDQLAGLGVQAPHFVRMRQRRRLELSLKLHHPRVRFANVQVEVVRVPGLRMQLSLQTLDLPLEHPHSWVVGLDNRSRFGAIQVVHPGLQEGELRKRRVALLLQVFLRLLERPTARALALQLEGRGFQLRFGGDPGLVRRFVRFDDAQLRLQRRAQRLQFVADRLQRGVAALEFGSRRSQGALQTCDLRRGALPLRLCDRFERHEREFDERAVFGGRLDTPAQRDHVARLRTRASKRRVQTDARLARIDPIGEERNADERRLMKEPRITERATDAGGQLRRVRVRIIGRRRQQPCKARTGGLEGEQT